MRTKAVAPQLNWPKSFDDGHVGERSPALGFPESHLVDKVGDLDGEAVWLRIVKAT